MICVAKSWKRISREKGRKRSWRGVSGSVWVRWRRSAASNCTAAQWSVYPTGLAASLSLLSRFNSFIISDLERIVRSVLLFVALSWPLLAPAGTHWHAFTPVHRRFHQTTIGKRMGLANKSVVLYQNVKTKTGWKLQDVVDDLPKFSKGPLYVSWDEGSKKRMEPIERNSEHALKMLNKKSLEPAYKAAGGEIKEGDDGIANSTPPLPEQNGTTKSVSVAVVEYLAKCSALVRMIVHDDLRFRQREPSCRCCKVLQQILSAGAEGTTLMRQRERDVGSADRRFRIAASTRGDHHKLPTIHHVGSRCGHASETATADLPQQLTGARCPRRGRCGRSTVAPMKSTPPAVTMGPP